VLSAPIISFMVCILIFVSTLSPFSIENRKKKERMHLIEQFDMSFTLIIVEGGWPKCPSLSHLWSPGGLG